MALEDAPDFSSPTQLPPSSRSSHSFSYLDTPELTPARDPNDDEDPVHCPRLVRKTRGDEFVYEIALERLSSQSILTLPDLNSNVHHRPGSDFERSLVLRSDEDSSEISMSSLHIQGEFLALNPT